MDLQVFPIPILPPTSLRNRKPIQKFSPSGLTDNYRYSSFIFMKNLLKKYIVKSIELVLYHRLLFFIYYTVLYHIFVLYHILYLGWKKTAYFSQYDYLMRFLTLDLCHTHGMFPFSSILYVFPGFAT